MKLLYLLIILFVYGCSKPQTVLICGDHVCINKDEAKQYFEENLTLEVKIIDNKDKKIVDLVQLNLKEDVNNKRNITVKKKNKTSKEIKVLTPKELKVLKSKVKKKKKTNKTIKTKYSKINDKKQIKKQNNTDKIITINKKNSKVVDICTIVEKCSIEEISKYLIKQGNKKGYPDITLKE